MSAPANNSKNPPTNQPQKTKQVQQQVDEVVGIMHENINKVMERGEQLNSLQNKTGAHFMLVVFIINFVIIKSDISALLIISFFSLLYRSSYYYIMFLLYYVIIILFFLSGLLSVLLSVLFMFFLLVLFLLLYRSSYRGYHTIAVMFII
jgi:hypothetical protein